MTAPTVTHFADLVGYKPTHGVEGEVHGTTVLALRFKDGVLNLADRRATAGNLIMYDEAEKILALDDNTLIAISGAFGRSIEVCRLLKHSFKYYRRAMLNSMSLEGKLMEISRALSNNAPMAMQGIGLFIPIVSAYNERTGEFGVYFYDGSGARFQSRGYACAGSGSERIRGVFEYLIRKHGPFEERPLDDVLMDALTMLDIAADLDSATGGFGKKLPIAHVLTANGISPVEPDSLGRAVKSVLG